MNEIKAPAGSKIVSFNAVEGGRNAIIFIVTQDVVQGYAAVTDWLQQNEAYRIHSISAQVVQMNNPLMPQPVGGFGITAILEIPLRRGFRRTPIE